MKNNKKLCLKMAAATLVSLVFLLAVGRFVLALNVKNTSAEYVLEEGWTITINGDIQKNIRLSQANVPTLHTGDQIFLECKLPDTGYENAILYFNGVRSIVDAYLENEKIYSYGREYLNKKTAVGSGVHLISLPADYAGKTLLLQIIVGEGDAFTYFRPIAINRAENVAIQYANKRLLSASISIFLVVLGVVIVLVSFFTIPFVKEFWRLLLIGFFSCCMGLWSMSYENVFNIFSNNLRVISKIEYISLYLAPVPLMLLMCDVRRDAKGFRKFNIYLSTIVVSVFAVISCILQEFGIIHFSTLLPIFHAIIGFTLTITLASVLSGIIQLRRSDMVLFMGIVVLCITALLDGIRYNLLKYVLKNTIWLSQSILPFGTLLMMIFMLISYAIYMFDSVKIKTRQETLEQQAYTDGLTGLFNRNKCREIFEELKEHSKKYTILNYDLNDLKYVNDHFGHEQGDLLLQSFADILRLSFGNIGSVIRMGGDEFIVVVENEDDKVLTKAIADYRMRLERSGETYGVCVSASYGIGKASELKEDATPEKIYNLADDRMYEMKKKSKV